MLYKDSSRSKPKLPPIFFFNCVIGNGFELFYFLIVTSLLALCFSFPYPSCGLCCTWEFLASKTKKLVIEKQFLIYRIVSLFLPACLRARAEVSHVLLLMWTMLERRIMQTF